MATTSPQIAAACLDALEAADIGFAVLHGEDRVAGGLVESDLDLVVDAHPISVLRRASRQLAKVDLHPIVCWTYDIGGTSTLFLVTSQLTEGVQLDLLHDPAGRGRYGVKSDEALARAVAGVSWPSLDPIGGLVYQARKRQVKAQMDRFEVASERLRSAGGGASVIDSLLSPSAARQLRRALAGKRVGKSHARLRNLGRVWSRLRTPAGAWIECQGPATTALSSDMSRKLGRVLPHVALVSRPGKGAIGEVRWWLREIAPVRWRAGIALSTHSGDSIGRCRPDVELLQAEGAYPLLVAQLEERLFARYGGQSLGGGH